MTTAVVVCTYTHSRLPLLREAVASLRVQTVSPVVIVVVDHNQQLWEKVSDEFEDVLVVNSTYPRGLSGARNTGAVEAASLGCEVVAFLDDDAVADPRFVEHLLSPFTYPQVAFTTGTALGNWVTERPEWLPESFEWVVGCSWRGAASRGVVRNPLGACMAARTSVFTTHMFDTNLGRTGSNAAGCEETELAARYARDRGMVTWRNPDACVTQVVEPAQASWGYFARRCFAEGVSKARVRARVGRGTLSVERKHVPVVLAEAASAARSGNVSRASSALAGLALAAAGYSWARLPRSVSPDRCAVGNASKRKQPQAA